MPNKIHTAFDGIKADEQLKNSTKEYINKEILRYFNNHNNENLFKRRGLYQVVAICCMFFIVCICAGGYYMSEKPVAYISIDVNPSIELKLNHFDKVISAKAYNEDGNIVLKDIDVKGKDYTKAIEIIVESDAMSAYLTEEYELTFTVASDNKSKESEILDKINKCSSCKAHKGQSYKADIDKIEEAHENGLSFGKYMAYQELSKYMDTVTIDDCKKMTMHELRSIIKEYKKEDCENEDSEKQNTCNQNNMDNYSEDGKIGNCNGKSNKK